MRVRFIRQWVGSYGHFPAGRECELSGAMLTACPGDTYTVKVRIVKSWNNRKDIFEKGSVFELTGSELSRVPKDVYQEVLPEQKETDSDGKSKKTKKAERPKKTD